MPEVKISDGAGRTLTFREPYRDSDGFVGCSVALQLDCGRAGTGLYDYGEPGLAGFFTALAARWQGFDGEESYETLSGHLTLSCTHDGRGTVHCEVTIREPSPPHWSFGATLAFEAGAQMQHIADDLSAFFANAVEI